MENPNIPSFPNLHLSHFELYVENVASMESFYTDYLGFVVTDRGEGKDAMVFLSRNPEEHHQLVLNPRQFDKEIESQLQHTDQMRKSARPTPLIKRLKAKKLI